jgi:hypothetical protein
MLILKKSNLFKMNCFICNDKPNLAIPLLVCGCYLCSACYCDEKSKKHIKCPSCNKSLKRGVKKNKQLIKKLI